jgi:DNA-binding NtrC family response regulator
MAGFLYSGTSPEGKNVRREGLMGLRRGTELILMIERDRSVKDLARDMLQRYGYSVLSAGDAEEAARLYRQNVEKIAVVTIDALSDHAWSRDLFTMIRTINPGARVIATSALSRHPGHRIMPRHGVDGHLRKPYRMTDLLNLVGRLLGEA